MAGLIPIGDVKVATDVTLAYEIRRTASQAQQAVDSRVQGVAADIIASDPTIRDAAENAVDGAAENGGFLRQMETGAVRTLATTDPLYAEIHMSLDMRRIGGLLRDGTVFETITPDGFAHSPSPAGQGTELVTRDYRRREPGSGPDGLTPQWVLDGQSDRMPSGNGLVRVVMASDSMGTDNSSLGTSVIRELGLALGIAVTDYGYAGDTPTQVAARIGALSPRVTIAGGILPTTGTVAVTVTPDKGWRFARDWQGSITTATGQVVQVRLVSSAVPETETPTWTLQQVNGSQPVTILPGARFKHRDADDRAAIFAPTIFWAGRNDLDLVRGRAAVRAVLDQVRDAQGRILILTVWNRTNEPEGSPGYTQVAAYNAMLQEEAGLRLFDGRAAIIRDGLTVAGISPTPEDVTAISEDRVPPSLLADTTHPNIPGREAFGLILANEILGRTW